MQVNLGLGITPQTKTSKFRLLADFRDIAGKVTKSIYKRLHLGADINVIRFVGATFGINQGYATGGAYLDLRFFRLDVGTYAEEVGDRAGARADRRYFLRLSLGF
jgi:hypothetical protein